MSADPAAPTPLLELRDIARYFPVRRGVLRRTVAQVKAVDGVTLTLGRGETLGLVGESGCGKSTLARLLMALDRPTAGRVLLDGQDLAAVSKGELRMLRRRMQMVLQDPYTSLNPRMTVGEIVGEPFEIHRGVVPAGTERAAIQELLELVGLGPDHVNRYPHQFSGGQRQRIGIARALALRPEVVICDEPVSALDVSVQAQVVNLLSRLQRELGLSYVFIAHDLSVVRHVADRVAVMYLGKVVELGDNDEVYGSPAHPYTRALLSAVPVPDPGRRDRRDRIILDGDAPDPVDPPSGCAFRTRCPQAVAVCAEQTPRLVVRSPVVQPVACHLVGSALRR